MAVNSAQGVNLYIQVANILRHSIISGENPPGARLPTVVELAEHFKVARITVREALRVLSEEGLLASSRGRGTLVLTHALRNRPAPQVVNTLSADSSDQKIIVLGVEDASLIPDEILGDATACTSYKSITKLHTYEGRPLGLMRIFVSSTVFRRFPTNGVQTRKILPMVREAVTNEPLELRFTVTVEPADVALVEHLGGPLGAPVAKIIRRLIDSKGNGIYLALSWHRGDMFSLTASIPDAFLPQVPTSVPGNFSASS